MVYIGILSNSEASRSAYKRGVEKKVFYGKSLVTNNRILTPLKAEI